MRAFQRGLSRLALWLLLWMALPALASAGEISGWQPQIAAATADTTFLLEADISELGISPSFVNRHGAVITIDAQGHILRDLWVESGQYVIRNGRLVTSRRDANDPWSAYNGLWLAASDTDHPLSVRLAESVTLASDAGTVATLAILVDGDHHTELVYEAVSDQPVHYLVRMFDQGTVLIQTLQASTFDLAYGEEVELNDQGIPLGLSFPSDMYVQDMQIVGHDEQTGETQATFKLLRSGEVYPGLAHTRGPVNTVTGSPYRLKQMYINYRSLEGRLVADGQSVTFRQSLKSISGGGVHVDLRTLNLHDSLELRITAGALEQLLGYGVTQLSLTNGSDYRDVVYWQWQVQALVDAVREAELSSEDIVIISGRAPAILRLLSDGSTRDVRAKPHSREEYRGWQGLPWTRAGYAVP